MLALAIALTLSSPVPGDVVRAFAYAGDPFARGRHRGIDLAATPGSRVRAACSGRVTFAGRAGANGRAVTVRCGEWSVTHLPLRDVAVRAGAHVVTGAPIGTVGTVPGHTGLHLGMRRASDRFGYVDPAQLLHEPPRHAPPVGPRTSARRHLPPPPHPAPLPFAPVPRPAPLPTAARAVSRPGSSPATHRPRTGLAPWPAWAGLALLLRRRRRRRRGARDAPTASCRAARARAAARYREPMSALLLGFGLGFFVAAQLGPLSLFAIRSTLRSGVAIGLAIGAGVAVIDTLYAAAGAAGAAGLLEIEPLRVAFGLAGAAVLIFLGVRTLVQRVPRPPRRRGRRGGQHAPAGVRHRARRDRVEPADDRLVGGDLRGGRRRRARPPAAASRCSLAGVGIGSMTWMAILDGRRQRRPPLGRRPHVARRRRRRRRRPASASAGCSPTGPSTTDG